MRLSDGKQLRFKACIAHFVHPTELHLELVPKYGYVVIIDLPEDTTLRDAIVAFVTARVPRWTHPEAPHELFARAGQLRGFPLAIYWLGTDRKSTRLNSSHSTLSRMPSSA